MTTLLRTCLVIIALTASWVAVASFLAHMESQTYLPLLIAVMALGAYFAVDYLEWERDRRIANARRETWERRNREAGL
jgi:hypothetical protein